MGNAHSLALDDVCASNRLGRGLGQFLPVDATVFVRGQLGSGKTTIVRAALRALGVTGPIPSPTYTLAEPYDTSAGRIWHLDLYRLSSSDELEYLGLRDLLAESAACLIEWPERAENTVLTLDLVLELTVVDEGRLLRVGTANDCEVAMTLAALLCADSASESVGSI